MAGRQAAMALMAALLGLQCAAGRHLSQHCARTWTAQLTSGGALRWKQHDATPCSAAALLKWVCCLQRLLDRSRRAQP